MTELTKEQLIEEAKLKIAIAKCHPNSEMARVEGELFKIALASLEAEPVGEFYEYKPGGWYQHSAGISIRLEIKRQSGYNSTLCRQRSQHLKDWLKQCAFMNR
ncbi:hypothetical protein G8G26_004312 [Escherichia coli]|nr:hypothetical protein [Escherichia coli]